MSKNITIKEAQEQIKIAEKSITNLLNELQKLTNASDISINVTKFESIGQSNLYDVKIVAEL